MSDVVFTRPHHMLSLSIPCSTVLTVALAISCIHPKQAHAQEHFTDCVSLTGSNANVIVPVSIEPRLDGDPLAAGDEIALFTPEGLCAGVITWNAGNGSITAWGENTITPVKDGFAAGDTMTFRVWDASAGLEATSVAVGYSSAQPFYRTEGTYNDNAIYALSSLDALTDPPSTGSNVPPAVGHPIEDQVLPGIGGVYYRDLVAAPPVFLDEDDNALTYSVHSSDPTVAEANVAGSVLSIEALAAGESVIEVTALDGEDEATTSFVVTVSLESSAGPVAVPDEVETREDDEVLIDVLRNDSVADDEAINVTMLISPSNGSASIEGKQIRYRPMANYNGRDSLVYHLHDLSGGAASARVTIVVSAVDDPPGFVSADAFISPEDGAMLQIGGATANEAGSPEDVLSVEWVEAIDVDGDPVRYVWTLARSDDLVDVAMEVETTAKRIEATHRALDDVLADAGVDVGGLMTLFHQVIAIAADASTEGEVRRMTLRRGELQSTSTASEGQPSEFRLDQNYPNPFNPETTISFSIARTAYVRLSVFDTLGQEVTTLLAAERPPGKHEVEFEAEDLTSGMYLYRLQTESRTATRRMVLLR